MLQVKGRDQSAYSLNRLMKLESWKAGELKASKSQRVENWGANGEAVIDAA
jgi:hypothetical protein